MLRNLCGERGHKLRTVAEFVDEVLFDRAYDLRASIVGFNLPFDISRLAAKHGSARGKAMRGGFTFKLSPHWWRPAIQVRHLNARASLIQFTHPPKRRDPRGQRKRKIAPRNRRGSFIDLKTIAAALLSRSFSLGVARRLPEDPDPQGRKRRPWETADRRLRALPARRRSSHLGVLSESARQVRAARPRRDAAGQGAERGEPRQGLSQADGRATIPRGPARFSADHLTGLIMTTYCGGKAEVHWRREIRQVLYCDFLSMYPTVCTLMGLWRFVIAQGMEWSDTTAEIRALVNSISLEDLQRPEFWPQLTTLVRVAPQADIFPVRAKYDGKSHTIGLNYLSSDNALWFTLADVVAAKLLGGKSAEILEAITFSPKAPQSNLRTTSIAGNSDYRVDPEKDDFFKRLIDLRTAIKTKLKNSSALNAEALDSEQQALKILASSTSYGIFVELNVADLDAPEKLTCYGPSGKGFSVESMKIEEPGKYFHPLLGTLITGAARLMLAIAESLCFAKGLDWAFCDTDSVAIAKPDGMDQAEFFVRAQSICDWFSPLNPYEKKGSIFKIEDANFPIQVSADGPKFEPLYCFCISAKRYALFNLGKSGEIIIRKASAHGLGHYLAPYEADDAPESIPAPSVALDKIGVDRWHYDLWHTIIRAALDGHPDQVDLSYHQGLNRPAASRYGATTPALLAWFKTFNAGREYGEQAKPFNFLLAFQARQQLTLPDGEEWKPKRGRPRKAYPVRPVAPFSRNVGEAAKIAFDRETGKSGRAWRPDDLREALAQYHLRPGGQVPKRRAYGQRPHRAAARDRLAGPSHRQRGQQVGGAIFPRPR